MSTSVMEVAGGDATKQQRKPERIAVHTLIEVEACRSTAVGRLGVRLDINEVLVLFTGGKQVFVYRDVPFDVLAEINKDTSLGKLVSKIKKFCKPVTGTKVFPEGCQKVGPGERAAAPRPQNKVQSQGKTRSSCGRREKVEGLFG